MLFMLQKSHSFYIKKSTSLLYYIKKEYTVELFFSGTED